MTLFSENGLFAKESQPKQSYRQVGRRTIDRVAMMRQDTAERKARGPRPVSSASIPNKYPNPNPRLDSEVDCPKGFNTSKMRFDYRVQNLPGPGAYYRPDLFNLLKMPERDPSVSCLGTGALASKANRFKQNSLNLKIPGPGQYNIRTGDNLSQRDVLQNARPSPAFIKGKRSRAEAPFVPSIPGPGEYGLEDSYNAVLKRGNGGVLFGKGVGHKKHDEGGTSNNRKVAPGRYNIDKAYKYSLNQGRGDQSKGELKESASFISNSLRGKELLSGNGVIAGPGDYNVANAEKRLQSDGSKIVQTSACFGGLGTDRFGQPIIKKSLQPETPGPGWYTPSTEFFIMGNSSKAKGAPFGSSANKLPSLDPKGCRPPGPAYYKPENVKGRSFFFNPSKKWV